MIENLRQYEVTCVQVQKFRDAVAGAESESNRNVPGELIRAEGEALRSQLADLEEQVRVYEAIPCYYYGCWGTPGHRLCGTGGRLLNSMPSVEYFGDRVHIDGSLAPRRDTLTGQLCWAAQGKDATARQRIVFGSVELPQAQFLYHQLDSGFSAIQWWDRCQGDERSGSSSTILFEGQHSSAQLLKATAAHFPGVIDNLARYGLDLVRIM